MNGLGGEGGWERGLAGEGEGLARECEVGEEGV